MTKVRENSSGHSGRNARGGADEPSGPKIRKLSVKIGGTHCTSCEVFIEQQLKKVPGVKRVHVSQASGKAELYFLSKPTLRELQSAVAANGYTVSPWQEGDRQTSKVEQIDPRRHFAEIGAVALIVLAAYLVLKQFDLMPKGLGIPDNMSYGFVFLIGLVAAFTTCIAVVGGLLLAVAAQHSERHPELTGLQKLKPQIYFNLGRIVSYTALGGVIGAVGSVLTISPKVTGLLTILASLAMLIIGIQLLNLFPWLGRFQPKMPKLFGRTIHDLSGKEQRTGPSVLGASTFFLPCGYTQALQLYILSTGGFAAGALTMLAFALGTLPALLSLGTISSFARGAFQRYFLKFAGVLVIALGFFNINNGLTLTGAKTSLAAVLQPQAVVSTQTGEPTAKVVDGRQIVDMKVIGLQYEPSRFTVVEGVPVVWRIDAGQAQGCAQVITVPGLGITEFLPPQGIKEITFTPQGQGTIAFGCTMAMTTPGASFTVVPNTTGIVPAPEQKAPEGKDAAPLTGPAQKVSMEVTEWDGRIGYRPDTLTVKRGVPVELSIDVKVPLGGCMSTMVIPDFDVAHPLNPGRSILRFAADRVGQFPITCSMGSPMAQLNVIN